MQIDAVVERATEGDQRLSIALASALRHDRGDEGAWLELAALVSSPAERRYCLRRALALNERNWQALGGIVELGAGPLCYPALLEQAAPAQPIQPEPPAPAQFALHLDQPPLPGALVLRCVVLCLLLALLVVALYRFAQLVPLA